MTRRFAVAVAFGAAALAFAADDPNAPLANTKQQLESLKKDEAAQKAGTQGKLQLDLPSLNTPASDLELPAPKREDADAKNKSADQKNWLLEGYDKLDKRVGAGRPDRRAAVSEKPLDPNDPNYFLRLYERQRAEREGRESERLDLQSLNASELKTAAGSDPFAPFMKGWLANSPVRDALKGTVDPGASSEAALVAAPTTSAASVTVTEVAPSSTPRPPATNPFVQALGLPALDQSKPTDVRTPIVTLQNPPAASTSPVPANTIYELPERPKVDLKQSLPPPPSEDKKYFPQLKKF